MKTFKSLLCLLVSIALLTGVLVLPAAAKDDTKLSVDLVSGKEGYTSVLYDNTNGLPTSEANAIAETDDGFIWIGSYGGLIRYNGSSFERISPSTGISSVVCLFVDSSNRLWIGSNDSGVAVMQKGGITKYNKDDGLRSLYVCSIVEESDGSIYIGTTQGIARFSKDLGFYLIDEPQLNNEYIHDLKVGADDVIYGRTNDGNVFTMRDGKLTGFYTGAKLGLSDIHCVIPDENKPGYVYLGTTGAEIYHGRLEDGVEGMDLIDVSPLDYINDIFQEEDHIWVCADNGIGIVTDEGVLSLEGLPLNSSVEGMMTDYQGNLWFVSSKQGVMKIVPNQFADIFGQYGLEPEVVSSTCKYDGKLLIGRKSSGLAIIENDNLVDAYPIKKAVTASGEDLGFTDLTELLAGSQIRSMIRGSQNDLWICSYGKRPVIHLADGTATCYTKEDGLPSERARAVAEAPYGKTIVAFTGGMLLIEDGKVKKVYGEEDGILNTEVLSVAVAGYDMILGTDGGGIYVVHQNSVKHIGIREGLASEVVMRVKKDSTRDIYWIVTSNSIAYMDKNYNVTTVSQFPYSNNFDLYENSVGEMWVLSSNGIYVVPVEQLLANEGISAVLYNRHNGLPCIATANSYSELTEDGDLYVAGSTGVAKINIENTFEDVTSLKMDVPYVEGDGVRYYEDDNGVITIPSSVVKVTVYDFVFTYSLMDPLVTYSLEGFDREATTLRRSEMTPVDYTNLSGGSYRFVMKTTDSHGKSSEEFSVKIVKEKAFYEELWFMVLCVLVLLALIILIVRLYINHKTKLFNKRQAEQKEIIKEVTEVLAKTIDMKDKYTNGHSIRVAKYTAMLARELGYDEETVDKFYNIALLHDIGKISIPPEVLNKSGKLTDEEFDLIKSHPERGYNTLKDIKIMPELAVGAESHHERPDGKGYPQGLKEEEIPRVAQIIAVADTFDAMYSDRPYRKRMNFDKVVEIMTEVSGTQLASDVVDAFLRLVEKGEMRAPDDVGGGSTEDIDNIHRKFEQEEKENQ